MIGRMLSAGLDTNPIIVDYSYDMPKYLKEQYLGMFIKYTGNNTDEYKNGYTYQVSQKQSGTDTVYFFAPYFYLESLASSADTSKIIDGYQAYNDNGKKIVGQYKTSEKVITENGTFYPADDSVNAYSKVTVNVAGETAENPYIATTDSEMEAYLAAEYKDSFVRMDYAKYRVSLPVDATYDKAKFNYESIGIPRMCAYIDKWLGSDSSKNVLTLKITGGSSGAELTVYVRTTVYKFSNADGTYGYALGVRSSSVDESGEYSDGVTPAFLYHIKSGTVIDGWTADKDYSIGWTYFGGDTGESTMQTLNGVIQLMYQGRIGSYTVAVSDALVLTNMAGSEVDNKYVEGAVYKVAAKYVENNNYVAESPFQVGDQLAGATVYLNQQITSDEFEALCDDLAKVTDFGFYEGMFIFANIDYPLVEPADPEPFYTPLAFLFAEQRTYSSGPNSQQQIYYQLGSYSLDTGSSDAPVILGKKSTANGLVTVSPATPSSFTVLSSITIPDAGTLTVPATITKINFPTLLNAIAGKTANFTKQSVVEAIYVPVLQASNGAYEEAQTEAELDAKIVNDNIGKIYQYTGATGNKYKNQSLYIILED